jgi:hypothetical protein
MAAIDSGELQPPEGQGGRFYYRADDVLELPWEPEESDQNPPE